MGQVVVNRWPNARRGTSWLATTILPGAVFGPVLTSDNLGSTQIVARPLS